VSRWCIERCAAQAGPSPLRALAARGGTLGQAQSQDLRACIPRQQWLHRAGRQLFESVHDPSAVVAFDHFRARIVQRRDQPNWQVGFEAAHDRRVPKGITVVALRSNASVPHDLSSRQPPGKIAQRQRQIATLSSARPMSCWHSARSRGGGASNFRALRIAEFWSPRIKPITRIVVSAILRSIR
jgi:hypothetical protein